MRFLPLIVLVSAVSACTQASPVMDTGNGTFLVSTRAAPAAGGTTGAYTRAHQEASAYCAARGEKPVLVGINDRDVYQSSIGGGVMGRYGQWGGGFAGGTSASGTALVQFKCR